jgi:chemotaxis protein CheD
LKHPLDTARQESNDDGLRRFLNRQDDNWHVQIMQGDFYVTGKPEEVLTTILGSCISACIRDPVLGIGGMNHFLLPECEGEDRNARRFGVNAMEVLINGILKRGGDRVRLEAKLFGGANVISAMSDVGSRNAAFARQFLGDEGIAIVGGDVGGTAPRRIQYWPVTGRARQLSVRVDKQELLERERVASNRDVAANDDVELF